MPARPNLFTDCPHCHARDSVVRPSKGWTVALAFAWLVFGASVVGIGLIGPFILFAGPVVLFSGAAVLGYLHGRVGEEASCSQCGKIARPVPPVELPAPEDRDATVVPLAA